MNTVFIGGSRAISRLPIQVREWLDDMGQRELRIVVGDADGVDRAIQKHFLDAAYPRLTVFCSGSICRNNLGHWPTEHVATGEWTRGYQFYAAKDRIMAGEADHGLMVWDGKSPGTALNVLRLLCAGKTAVLFNVPARRAVMFKRMADWDLFLSEADEELRRSLRERATDAEWLARDAIRQPGGLDSLAAPTGDFGPLQSEAELHATLDEALKAGDAKAIIEALGRIARVRGMSRVARDTGLAREGLYRALSADGNPEFSTVLKVLNAMGFRLGAMKLAA